MSKLPFVVGPRQKPRKVIIGTEESGQIEIDRKGFLTAGEKSFMQTNSGGDEAMQRMMKLARKVATKNKTDVLGGYNLIVSALQKEETKDTAALWDKFGDELNEVMMGMMQQQSMEKLLKATCLLIYRVDNDIRIEDVNCQDQALVDALADLYDKEEARSSERLMNELGLETQEEAASQGLEAAEKK